MKKIINKSSLFVVIILFILLIKPLNTNNASQQPSYNNIEANTISTSSSEDNKYETSKLEINIADYFIFIIPIIFLIISILLWFIYGRDKQIIETTVEFYPPNDLNSLDAAFIYKGKAESKDVTSLLIFLANKGYLEICNGNIDLNAKKVNLNKESKINTEKKIIELQEKIKTEKSINPSSKKIKYYENMLNVYKDIDTSNDYDQSCPSSSINGSNFIIKKLKDYDGTDINEKLFMDGLFESDKTEVTDKMLYNKFYTTTNKILHNTNSRKNKNKIFEKSSSNKKILIIIMLIIAYFLITIPPILNYGQANLLFFALSFPVIGFSVLFNMLLEKKTSIKKILGIEWGIMFGGGPWLIIVLPSLLQNIMYLKGYFIGIICIVGMALCLMHLSKRTKYGNEMLGKLKGFKNFLETAEKEKLESMVMENPNYFYNILPFTYVLGVSDKWIKKIECISIKSPSWYQGPNSFNVSHFGAFMDSIMIRAHELMISDPTITVGRDSSIDFS